MHINIFTCISICAYNMHRHIQIQTHSYIGSDVHVRRRRMVHDTYDQM